MTKKPWIKQLCFISNDGKIQTHGTIDIVKRHLVHRRCKTPITIIENKNYCNKCKLPLPTKSICYLSYLTNDILRNKNVTIGEALIDNIDDQILLIDIEYIRRDKNIL